MAIRWVKSRRSRAPRRCIGLAWLVYVAVAGCGSDAGSEPDNCAELAQTLRACGLLSEGTYDCTVQESDRPRADCLQECFAATDCSTLTNAACSARPEPTPDTLRLSSCITQCDVQFGFQCVEPRGGPSAVDPAWVCDAEPDCADASDEAGCEMFSCGDGQEVATGALCDGFADCGNARDESTDCEQFTCADGMLVPESFRCDSTVDCADGSDEAACGSMAVVQCPPEEQATPPASIACNPAAQTGCSDPGSACARDSDCRADSLCDPTLHCAQLCDPAHPCDALTCTPIGNGINLCQ